MAQPDLTTLREHYAHVCKSLNDIDAFRLKILGLLPLASGLSSFALADLEAAQLRQVGYLGALVAIGLYLYEVRGAQRCVHLKDVARALEARLGLDAATGQFLHEPPPYLRLVREGTAGVLIYLAVVSYWILLPAILG